jgi:hypothetical protein
LQGDPLASIYFAAALHPTLLAIDTKLREFAAAAAPGSDRPGFVVAIADDIMIQAPLGTIFQLAPVVAELRAEVGLRTNLRKSFILGTDATTLPDPPVGWRIADDGGKTLGRPLGSRAAQEAWIKTALAKQEPPTRALRTIAPQCAMMVLKMSCSHRFDYLRKVTVKDYGRQLFADYDALIDASLLSIAAAPGHEYIRDIRELPLDKGGFGIPSQSGITAMRHYLTTQRRTQSFLEQHGPTLLPVHNNKYYRAEGEFELFDEMHQATSTKYAALVTGANQSNAIHRYTRAARLTADVMIQARAAHLHATLAENPHSQAAAAQFLSSMGPHTGSWLRSSSLPLFGTGISFSNADFREMIRSRALIPFTAVYGQVPTTCASCTRHPVNLAVVPMHPLVCPGSKGIIQSRHDQVRDRLARLIKTVLPTSNTQTEPDNHQGTHLHRRPDLRFEDEGEIFYIDVVVAEPTAQSALGHATLSSINTPGGAARAAELRKTAQYATADQDINVAPFAVESTGRLGPAAQALLNRLCADEDKAHILGAFNSDLSFILASAKGRLLSVCRNRLAVQDDT